eukprot:scaffold650601_cov37-Prasinocladus_malaysianus.AAC.1
MSKEMYARQVCRRRRRDHPGEGNCCSTRAGRTLSWPKTLSRASARPAAECRVVGQADANEPIIWYCYPDRYQHLQLKIGIINLSSGDISDGITVASNDAVYPSLIALKQQCNESSLVIQQINAEFMSVVPAIDSGLVY